LPRPYPAKYVLRAVGRDPESRCERVVGSTIIKPLAFGTLTILLERGAARCRVDRPCDPDDARNVAVRLLGLTTDPRPFERRHTDLVEGRRGLRIPLTATVFEAIAWAIVGQQVNLAFAFKLRRALVELASGKGDLVPHPEAAQVAKLDYADLTARQYSRRKAEYLIDTARLIAGGALDAEGLPGRRPEEVRERLLAVRGFGEWSTNYVMMRGCGFENCLPLGDTGLTTSLQRFFRLDVRPGRAETEQLMRQFEPYRSLATFHLWMRLHDSAM
jgi:3-methyladenine DNA glycosylase/8-oxoguanine DNA glycosylase